MATDGRKTGIHSVMDGKLLANRWQVLDVVGSGGMGVVYRCWDMNLKTTVAVKVLNSEFQDDAPIVERFHREIETLIKSAHQNIVVIHACSSKEDEPPIFLVMEFLTGQTLNAVLHESPSRRLHPQRILRITSQILDALDAVHKRGIIHRDLKPENVFVMRTGSGRRNADVVKVVDFGIAKSQEGQSANNASLTQVGSVVGTPYYMSPEQCLGASYTDHRADIYATGVMLFEMATGKLPFDKPSREEIMTAHIAEVPASPRMLYPDISPELEMVILRAMAKKPERRFQDATEFDEALEAAIPEDRLYYRDSQRPSPVNGATPPRVRMLAPPGHEPPPPPPDVSATPTNLLEAAVEPAVRDIGLAETITPTDLDREARAVAEAAAAASEEATPDESEAAEEALPLDGASSPETRASGTRVPLDVAIAYLKQCGVWIGEVPQQTKILVLAGVGLAILLLVLVVAASRGCHGSSTAADAGETFETTVAAVEAETPAPPAKQPDALMIRVPVPTTPVLLPAPADATAETAKEATDVKPTEQVDYTAEVSMPDVPEVTPETILVGPPAGYEELLAGARRARNWRTAVARLEEATRLWPEGPDAWEALGNVFVSQRGQTARARTAYARCLELLPTGALSRRATVEGKLRGLR